MCRLCKPFPPHKKAKKEKTAQKVGYKLRTTKNPWSKEALARNDKVFPPAVLLFSFFTGVLPQLTEFYSAMRKGWRKPRWLWDYVEMWVIRETRVSAEKKEKISEVEREIKNSPFFDLCQPRLWSPQVRESGFRNPWGVFACGIRNPGFWNPEYSSRNPESYWRLKSESKFH